jgi:chaperonin GroEL
MNDNIRRIVGFDEELRAQLLLGINILADAVRITMGPKGKNVLIERPGLHPVVTKDGVTVAKSINLSQQFQNMGVQIIKEAASRTAEEAGDGTTSATVLAQAIFAEGLKMISAGHDPVELRHGIDIAVKSVLENLHSMTKTLDTPEELYQVALISANGEEDISRLISDAVGKVGQEGTVTVENAKGFNSSLSFVEGIKVDRGYLSPYFVTNQDKMHAILEGCIVLLCDFELETLKDVMKPLELALESSKPLLIVANEISNDVMQGLVLNKVKGALKACAIKSPGFGQERHEMMEDLAVITGGKVVGNQSDLDSFSFSDFGTCKRVIVKRTASLFIGTGKQDSEIEKRVAAILARLNSDEADPQEAEFLSYRIRRLTGGIAVLKVGASTEAELIERKDRVDDALNATKAALDEGILPGGGVALVRSAMALDKLYTSDDSVDAGIRIVKNACESPLRQIVRNAGKSEDLILERVKELKGTQGYDARLSKFGDMLSLGILDPHKVVRCAIENAASTASMLLSAGAAMIEEKSEIS